LLTVAEIVAHNFEETFLGLLFVLLGHLTGGDVFQVLEPLEVGASDTTAVDEEIGAADNTTSGEDLLSLEGSRAVGTLEDGVGLDVLGVTSVKGLLDSSGDKVVAFKLEEAIGVVEFLHSGTGEAIKGTVLFHEVLNVLHNKTVGVVDSRVVFNNGGHNTTVLLKEVGGPVSDSAESLDSEGAALDTLGETDLLVEGLVGGHFADSVVDTETSGLVTSVDTALSNELTSAAALSVDILFSLNVHVGILDPGHDLFVGTHVGSEAINGSTNEALLDKLHGVLTGNTLEFSFGEFTGVDLDTTLTATEWDIGDGELEGHQGGKGLNFLKIDVIRVSSTALAGELVGGVLGSVASDSL
jgi:hypothetical protein